MQDLFELLERLTRIPGPPGREDGVCIAIQDELAGRDGEIGVDGIGNLVLRLPAPSEAPSLLLMAHMDQIGLISKHIDENGFVYCERNGLVDERTLLASKIQIWTEFGPRLGVVGVRSRHLLREAEVGRIPETGDLWRVHSTLGPDSCGALD